MAPTPLSLSVSRSTCAVALAAVDLDGQAGRARTPANDTGGQHGHVGLRLPETKQPGEAVRFGGFSFELGDAQFQRVILATQLLVIFPGTPQRKVVAPGVAEPAKSVGAHAFKGRDRSHGPGANQAPLRITLDLHREQEHLEQDDPREQN